MQQRYSEQLAASEKANDQNLRSMKLQTARLRENHGVAVAQMQEDHQKALDTLHVQMRDSEVSPCSQAVVRRMILRCRF